MILLRGIQITHVQCYWGSTVKMVFSLQMFTFHEANTCVALPNAHDGVRSAHFPSVITTIMDQKVELLKPVKLRELYTTKQNQKVTGWLHKKRIAENERNKIQGFRKCWKRFEVNYKRHKKHKAFSVISIKECLLIFLFRNITSHWYVQKYHSRQSRLR
jgi:hypothetical protein